MSNIVPRPASIAPAKSHSRVVDAAIEVLKAALMTMDPSIKKIDHDYRGAEPSSDRQCRFYMTAYNWSSDMNNHVPAPRQSVVSPAILPNMTGDTLTMSSREIAELVGSRHDKVKQSIERLADRGVIGLPPLGDYLDSLGRKATEYRVGKRDSYVIVAQLSPEFTARLVDRWQELENQIAVPAVPTTAEAFANAFLMIASAEKVQAEHAKAIARIEEKVERVEVAQTVLRSRPANAEGITHIRTRINRIYGLSVNVIDEVMRQSPYAPKPAGMVRNDHVDADGSLYAVYWQKDVTKTFDRFVNECTPVTAFMFTHPFIEGRFRVTRKEVTA